MQAIDVLRDHRLQQPASLELGQRLVGRVWLFVGEHVETGAVEVPEALRVTVKGVDRRHRHRVHLLP